MVPKFCGHNFADSVRVYREQKFDKRSIQLQNHSKVLRQMREYVFSFKSKFDNKIPWIIFVFIIIQQVECCLYLIWRFTPLRGEQKCSNLGLNVAPENTISYPTCLDRSFITFRDLILELRFLRVNKCYWFYEIFLVDNFESINFIVDKL